MKDGKRRYVRLDSLNLLDYVILGDRGEIVAHSMGRTLNISEKGILLETHIPFTPGQHLLVTIGLEEDLVDVKCQVKHAEEADEKLFRAGMEFVEIDKEGLRVIKGYLKAFAAFKG